MEFWVFLLLIEVSVFQLNFIIKFMHWIINIAMSFFYKIIRILTIESIRLSESFMTI